MARADMIKHIVRLSKELVAEADEVAENTKEFQVGDLQVRITASIEAQMMRDPRTYQPIASKPAPAGMSRILKREFRRKDALGYLHTTIYFFDVSEVPPNDAWKTVKDGNGNILESWKCLGDEEIGEVFDLLIEVTQIGKLI